MSEVYKTDVDCLREEMDKNIEKIEERLNKIEGILRELRPYRNEDD